MTMAAIAGWMLAVALGAGWWIDHRGIAGIRRDLADAKAQFSKIKGKVK